VTRLLALGLLFVAALDPAAARAQREAPLLDASLRVELEAAERQAALADGLYIGGGATAGAGLATLLGASVALAVCAGSCSEADIGAAEITIGVSVALIGAGLITLVVATFIDGDAEAWRRRVLSSDLSARSVFLRW